MKSENQINGNVNLWKSIAIIAGVFAFIICILIIANYVQLNRSDPVNTMVINDLVERLKKTPADQELRNEIREFELLARKAYFTNQWQIRTGGYILIISIIVLIIAMQLYTGATKKMHQVSADSELQLSVTQKNSRKWITIGGMVLAGVTLLFAFLSHNQLGEKYLLAAYDNKNPVESSENTSDNSAGNNNSSNDPDSNVIIDSSIDTLSKDLDSSAIEDNKDSIITQPQSGNYPTAAMKQNFPSFRGPGGNGYAWQTNIPENWDGASGKNIKWKTKVPLQGFNSPVIWGDKVFLSGATAESQQVYCFDINTGKILWTKDVKNISGAPEKAPKVTDDTGHSAATLTTDGTKVYAIFSNGNIVALDMAGKIAWSRNLGVPSNHYGYSSSLVLVSGKIIVQYDHKSSAKIMALSTSDGSTVWSTDRKVKTSWASPVVVHTGSRIEIIVIADPVVASYDPGSGKELWQIECTYGEVGPSVVYANGIIFGMNEYAKLAAIQIGDKPKIIWDDNEFLSDVPSPVATDKYVFIPTSYGVMACYDIKTGEMYWDHDFGNGFYSSPIIAENKIYMLDRQGIMHIMKPDKTFSLVAEPKLGEKSDCTPAFANGKILIRAGDNLYCIGK